MKVLHIAPTPFFADRGCHIRIFGEINALQENGAEVELSTYHLGRNIEKINTNRTLNIPWYKQLSVGGSWHKLYMDFFLLIVSVIVAIKFKPLLIHGHLHEGALIAKITSWIVALGNIPVIFDVQGSLTGELKTYGLLNKNGFIYKIFFKIEKFICQLPDHIICSSNSNKKFIINDMNIPSENVTELIDGIHSNNFIEKDENKLKKSLGINKEKVVVYSGSLESSKGVSYFVEAIPQILEKYNNVKFLVIGYPVEKIKAKAEELKIDKSIIFLNKVNFFKLPEYLSIADIAVDPKVDKAGEGSGKIVNYMGAGLPVVCFDSLNNRNFFDESGVFAKSGDSNDLAEKILLLLNDEAKCKDLGKRNKIRVEKHFSWNTKGKELINIYKKVIIKKKK
ncbi:MAG: glycosyltransferase family 4 protein [Melioribacteraceae bacterium]